VNVKCLFDGEDEIGSPNLSSFVSRNRYALYAAIGTVSDARFVEGGPPAIVFGLSGELVLELEISGQSRKLYCGISVSPR
jgi:hypothetical protein